MTIKLFIDIIYVVAGITHIEGNTHNTYRYNKF